LKKSLLTAVFIFTVITAAIASDKPVLVPSIISLTGQVESAGGQYLTGRDSTVSIKAGLARIDLFPESGAGQFRIGQDLKFKLEKGTIWVRCGDQKAVITAGPVLIEAGDAVFSASLSSVSVYSGFVTVRTGKKSVRAGMGKVLELANWKLSGMAGQPETDMGAAAKIRMDKFDMLCSVNLETRDFINAREAFTGAFSAFYYAGHVYFSFDSPKDDYDLSFDLKIDRKEQKYQFRGLIKNPMTNETIGVFSDDEPADQNGLSSGLIKAGLQAGRAIQYYGSKVLTEGTRVFVEAEGGNTENANEIKEILETTPGVSSLKSTDFQGKKAVFEMLFTGNGYDLAGILKDRKVQNKHINIWKYSKFVVKLTIA
jgi:hypothetical protein